MISSNVIKYMFYMGGPFFEHKLYTGDRFFKDTFCIGGSFFAKSRFLMSPNLQSPCVFKKIEKSPPYNNSYEHEENTKFPQCQNHHHRR